MNTMKRTRGEFIMCCKCKSTTGLIILAAGILFLLRDLGVWNFWNIQWWSIIFIVGGMIAMCKGSGCCSEGECCTKPEKKEKKK